MARSVLLVENGGNGTSTAVDWDGGEGVIFATGTWDSATVTLQYSPISPVSGLTLTPADTDIELSASTPQKSFSALPAGSVRVVIASGGGSESLTVAMARAK